MMTTPTGKTTEIPFTHGTQNSKATVHTDWIEIEDKDAKADMFYVFYESTQDRGNRPITFVMNGGPGASASYLHLAALGPQRIDFGESGELLSPPTKLVTNEETWLGLTDLVFIDPVETGLSRYHKPEKDETDQPRPQKANDQASTPNHPFGTLSKDLEAIGKFCKSFLKKHGRWGSPVYFAGESYGGFRGAMLSRHLQEKHGVGLSGVVLISPCYDWSDLVPNDYDIQFWVNAFPSYVATAWHHGKYRADQQTQEAALAEAEQFASTELALLLVSGDAIDPEQKKRTCERFAQMTGLSSRYVEMNWARIPMHSFVREVLKEETEVACLYDSTQKLIDPYPNREKNEAPDTTISASERAFTSALHQLLFQTYKLETDRDYRLLNFDVFKAWKNDKQEHAFDLKVDPVDDLRFALSMNPYMQVLVVHGIHDLVTPYYLSKRTKGLMRLGVSRKDRIKLANFRGGHMFYTWNESRKGLLEQAKKLYQN